MVPASKLAASPCGYIFLVAYSAVLVAELVGDKALYTVASLVLRLRAGIVFAGITIAFAGKMLAAALLGRAIVQVPSKWTSILSVLAFFASALLIWLKEPEPLRAEPPASTEWWRAMGISFGSLFFTEWADPGQISAAALSAQTRCWLPVWLGGTLALATKGGLALTLGLKLRDRLPQRMLRPLASASCCVLGILALVGLFFP